MKSIKKIAFILFLSVLSSQVYSQISIGGQASFFNLFGGSGLKNIGLGFKGEYAQSEKTVFLGGINYYIPSKFSRTTYGYAFNSMTSPQQVDIDVEYKVSFTHIYIGVKRYFAGDYEDDFGFYGLAEAGLLLAPTATTLGNYNKSLYYTVVEDGKKEVLGNFTINFGLGFEKSVGSIYIFSDVKLNLPANRSGDVEVDFDIPTSLSVNAGVRVPF